MRPHPRIRKTIKWGGAVVSLSLLVLWPMSEMRGGNAHTPLLPQWEWVCAYDSNVWINSPWWGSAFGWNDQSGRYVYASGYFPSWAGGGRTGGAAWGISIPIWNLLGVSTLATGIAWHLDALASRREREGKCPKCNYDRAGIAAGAKCPECGSAAP